MTSVLGVSMGASAVRFASRDAETPEGSIFRSRPITATLERPGEPAGDSIEWMLAETREIEQVEAIGVAYQNDAQAGAVHAAMTRLEIGHFQLVPEVTAALQMLEMSGQLGENETLVFYDLGSSGLTVTVVDRSTGKVLSTTRSDQISGNLVDRLVLDDQLHQQRFERPADLAAQLALTARCRDAKEQLSTKGAVCIAGEGGLLLLSQDSFDSLIDGAVKTSARLTREVIQRSGRTPDAAVLIGGGANIPLIASVMESWLDLPVIVPEQPELVAAEGAALLAHPAAVEFADHTLSHTEVLPTALPAPSNEPGNVAAVVTHETPPPPPAPKRRTFALAGGVVALAAAIGLGTVVLQDSEGDVQPAVTQQDTQPPAARQVAPPQPAPTSEMIPTPETAPAASVVPPVVPAQAQEPITYQPQTQVPAQAPTAETESESAAPPATPDAPEPSPLIPGLPEIQLPTLPPPPTLPLPELPSIPGF
ncbi:Hsp70 family protein [Rhodococcus sp. HNM0563]|uniref:Hsp70 family protein n=1 Tax=unclassified Rhodococcus (in: high G+C Gram-positive bacteria) TaxID=192944 RepID=UPI00146BBA5B|nr:MULTISPECIES: Hsp70 family protein [unclassified Rhodococcus (in: high G+C Gram-positive bacteria)]MCK0090518.1 Hsp70 family protein [Rhodococcus sp. F64268]NLU61733.1 Hsp70 family protein [Rhodococcus sp. HNM0563]